MHMYDTYDMSYIVSVSRAALYICVENSEIHVIKIIYKLQLKYNSNYNHSISNSNFRFVGIICR